MRIPFSYIILILLVGVLHGCGWVEIPADGQGGKSYGRSTSGVVSATKLNQPAEIPGTVVVQKGDTVYAISRKTGVSVRDIIEANNLTAPFHLRVGQRLRLPQDPVHIVRPGDTLYSVSRAYRTDVYTLAKTNNLQAPFTLTPGQRLKLPSQSNLTTASKQLQAPAATKTDTASKPAYTPPNKPRIAKKTIPTPPKRAGSRFAWPTRGKVISSFGSKQKGLKNDGINISAKRGSAVKAAENGVVAYSGNELPGFGNMILLKHSDGWITAYAHNEKNLVTRGQKVKKGQAIASVGSSGGVVKPQLHFEVRKGMNPVNPTKYLGG